MAGHLRPPAGPVIPPASILRSPRPRRLARAERDLLGLHFASGDRGLTVAGLLADTYTDGIRRLPPAAACSR